MALGTLATIALAVGGSALGAWNNNQLLKHQDAEAAAGIRRQSVNQDAATARVNQTVQGIHDSSSEDARKTAQAQYLEQFIRQRARAKTGLAAQGVSDSFDALAGQEAGQVDAFGGENADLLSRMDAPILQREHEGLLRGNLGMDLSRIGGDVRGTDFMNQLRLHNIRKNPWIDLASGIMSGLAQGGGRIGAASAAGSGPYVGSGYGSTWGTGAGLAAAGFGGRG